MVEIKRYRCIKECEFNLYDDDGKEVDGKYMRVKSGSIWQEGMSMIAGGTEDIHLDMENGRKWCEPSREMLAEHFEQIESLWVGR